MPRELPSVNIQQFPLFSPTSNREIGLKNPSYVSAGENNLSPYRVYEHAAEVVSDLYIAFEKDVNQAVRRTLAENEDMFHHWVRDNLKDLHSSNSDNNYWLKEIEPDHSYAYNDSTFEYGNIRHEISYREDDDGEILCQTYHKSYLSDVEFNEQGEITKISLIQDQQRFPGILAPLVRMIDPSFIDNDSILEVNLYTGQRDMAIEMKWEKGAIMYPVLSNGLFGIPYNPNSFVDILREAVQYAMP